MIKLFLTLFAAFVFITNAHGDEPEPPTLKAQSTLLPQYEHRIGLNFPIIGVSYERTKPNSYYIGIDGEIFFPTFNLDMVKNVEARSGYHFFNGTHHHFTATGGGGYLQIQEFWEAIARAFGQHEGHPKFVYTSLGFRYEYEQIKSLPCSIGINAQGLLAYRLPKEWNHSPTNHGKITAVFPVFGFKGSIPVTFRFGQQKNWDFRFEPFFLYLASHKIKVDMTSKFLWLSSEKNYEIKERFRVSGLNLSIGRRF